MNSKDALMEESNGKIVKGWERVGESFNWK